MSRQPQLVLKMDFLARHVFNSCIIIRQMITNDDVQVQQTEAWLNALCLASLLHCMAGVSQR